MPRTSILTVTTSEMRRGAVFTKEGDFAVGMIDINADSSDFTSHRFQYLLFAQKGAAERC
jgi:hypothetical protein